MNSQITGSVFSASVIAAAGTSTDVTATDTEGNQVSTTFTVAIVAAAATLECFRSLYGLAADGSENYDEASGNGVASIFDSP